MVRKRKKKKTKPANRTARQKKTISHKTLSTAGRKEAVHTTAVKAVVGYHPVSRLNTKIDINKPPSKLLVGLLCTSLSFLGHADRPTAGHQLASPPDLRTNASWFATGASPTTCCLLVVKSCRPTALQNVVPGQYPWSDMLVKTRGGVAVVI